MTRGKNGFVRVPRRAKENRKWREWEGLRALWQTPPDGFHKGWTVVTADGIAARCGCGAEMGGLPSAGHAVRELMLHNMEDHGCEVLSAQIKFTKAKR